LPGIVRPTSGTTSECCAWRPAGIERRRRRSMKRRPRILRGSWRAGARYKPAAQLLHRSTLMSIVETPSHLLLPAPRTLQEAGLSRDLITQLLLKTLHFSGELAGTELARRLGLSFGAIEPVLSTIKQHHHVEISGGALGSSSYHYRITDAGRTRAMLFLEQNHYVGFAPVPLEQYRKYMHDLKAAMPHTVD